jgi:hypothetical protein
MSDQELKGPYIYQPFGMQDEVQWQARRIYGIAGLPLTTVKGLTRTEAEKILEIFTVEVSNEPDSK